MISRTTALAIAEIYTSIFRKRDSSRNSSSTLSRDRFYDFLFEKDYEAWFCNVAIVPLLIRDFKVFLMKLHTGESLASVTDGWSWDKRRELGNTYLRYLAGDILLYLEEASKKASWSYYDDEKEKLIRALELDGFVFRDGELFFTESDVLNLEEERGILERLYSELGLKDSETAFEFLRLSEEHYRDGRWADCIANSRKFLESVLQNSAEALSKRFHNCALSEKVASRPVEVREFLTSEGLIEKKEREALDKVYGLLSHTGSHPYMAEKDQARLLRQMGLTLAHFILLRLEGRVGAR